MPTTSLAFTRSWFTEALDPTSNPVVCGTRRPQERTDAVDGFIRQYSSGRTQAASTATKLSTITVQLVGLSWSAWMTVLGWMAAGTTVLFRSVAGERHYVRFFTETAHPILNTSMNDGRGFDVTLTLYVVDYDESV